MLTLVCGFGCFCFWFGLVCWFLLGLRLVVFVLLQFARFGLVVGYLDFGLSFVYLTLFTWFGVWLY